MPFCPSPDCPHRKRLGEPAEFLKGVAICSDCGSPLSETLPILKPIRKPQRVTIKKAQKIAAIAGVIPACLVFSSTVGDFSPGQTLLQAVIERITIIVLTAGFSGVIFGYSWPVLSWRWGIWINIPNFLVIILFALMIIINLSEILGRDKIEALYFFSWWFGIPSVAFVAACIGAYAGARFRGKKGR